MDFYTIRTGQHMTNPQLFDSIVRLFPVFPQTDKEVRILDPFAGDGAVIQHLSQAWGMKPYAIENYYANQRRLRSAVPGAIISEAVGDALVTPHNFTAAYNYPPYDGNNPLAELNLLRIVHAWVQRGGYMLNVLFENKLTQSRDLLEWMWRTSEFVDVFFFEEPVEGHRMYLCVCKLGDHPRYLSDIPAGPFKAHLHDWWWTENNPVETRQLPIFDEEGFQSGCYDTQFVKLKKFTDELGEVISIGPVNADEKNFGPSRLAQATIDWILAGAVPPMSAVETPIYAWPEKVYQPRSGHISFRPRKITEEAMVQCALNEGIHLHAMRLLQPVGEPAKLRPIVTPARSQSGIVIASGALGDAIRIVGQEHNVLVRAKTQYVTRQVNYQEILDEQTHELRRTVTTYKSLPTTSITTLDERGVVSSIVEDDLLEAFVAEHGEALMDFMEAEFPPIYDLDNDPRFAYFKQFIEMVQVRGEIDMAPNQMKLVAGIVSALMEMKGVILEGEMGVGKSIMTATIAHLMRSIAYNYKYSLRKLRKDNAHKAVIWPGEVVLLLVPPTTATDENWLGEFARSIPNCEIFLGSSMADANACLAACDESKQALVRIKADGGTDDDWGLASRLNVLIVPESTAKENEGWIHAPWIQRHFSRANNGRIEASFMARDPRDGHFLTRASRGTLSYLDEDGFQTNEDGSGKGKKFVSGSPILPALKFEGDPTVIELAYQEYLASKLRYDQRLANNYWAGRVVSEESQTHLPVEVSTIRLDEEGQPAHYSNGAVIHDSQTNFRHPVDQAMMDIRKERRVYEATHNPLSFLWQNRRGTSSLERLTKVDARQKLRELTYTDEVIEARKLRIQAQYPHADAAYWAQGGPIMPLPDLMSGLVPDAEWLVGVHEKWTNGRSLDLASFILKKFHKRIGLFAADELHQYKNIDAQRAIIMTRMANAARNALGLTGTLFGGTADTVFLLLYIFSKDVRKEYPDLMSEETQARWQAEMGVTEWTKTVAHLDANGNAAENPQPKTSAPHKAPGAAPRLVKAAMPCTVRFNMKDMGIALPPFTQIPVPIPMDEEERVLYGATEDTVEVYDAAHSRGKYRSFGMAKFQGLMGLVNSWWRGREFWHRMTWDKKQWDEYIDGQRESDLDPNKDWVRDTSGKPIRNKVQVRKLVVRVPGFGEDRLSSKERWMIRMINGEVAEGRGVALYVSQSGAYDIRPRLESLIKLHCPNAKPFILNSSVDSRKRSGYINSQAARGMNVMITNAKLVEVGLNLLAFPTITFYEIHYSLYVMAQASRRSWRLNQPKACRVYYPYSVKTGDPEEAKTMSPVMEQRAMNVIAKKERTAAFMRGDRLSGLSQIAMEDGEEDLQKYASRMMEMGGNQSAFILATEEAFREASVNAEGDSPRTYMEEHVIEEAVLSEGGDGEREALTQEELEMPIEDMLEGLLEDGIEVELTILDPVRHEIEHLLPNEEVRALYYQTFGDEALTEPRLQQLRYAIRLYDGEMEAVGAALIEIGERNAEEGNPMPDPVQQIGSALPDELVMNESDLIGDLLDESEPVRPVVEVQAPVLVDHRQDEGIVAALLEQHEAELVGPVGGPRFAATIEPITTRYIAENGDTCQIDIPLGTIMQIDEEWEDEATLMDGAGFILWVKPEQYEEVYDIGPLLPEQLESVLQWMQVVPEKPEVRIRFEYRVIWGAFIDGFPKQAQNRVKLIFAELESYGGVRLNRRQFVEKSAAAVLPVSDGPEGHRLGEFSITAGEAAYARFIYRYLPEYQQIMDGEALAVTPFPDGLSHTQILSYTR